MGAIWQNDDDDDDDDNVYSQFYSFENMQRKFQEPYPIRIYIEQHFIYFFLLELIELLHVFDFIIHFSHILDI